MVGLKTFFSGVIASVAVATPVYAAQADAADCLRGGAQPSYAALDAPPIAEAARVGPNAVGAPAGAGCFGKSDSAAIWITVASVIRSADSRNTLVGRFGAITQLLTAQYWSTTEQKWRPLVSSAFATAAPDSTQPRGDYSMGDLVTGANRYYQVTDTRSGRGVTYRLKVLPSQPGRIVIETANVDVVRKWGLTIYPAEGLHTFYFLDERSPGVWAYYSITRVLPKTFLAEGHEKSYINRAVALYRHYVRLPTNAEPPAAP
jgi:hypothetical protein